MISTRAFRNIIREALEPYCYSDFLSLPQVITVTQAKDTTADTTTAGTAITPPAGRVFYLHYVKLITDPEVKGNVLLTTGDTSNRPLLAEDQDENQSVEHDLTKLTMYGIRCKSINVRSATKVALTEDRKVRGEFGIQISPKLW